MNRLCRTGLLAALFGTIALTSVAAVAADAASVVIDGKTVALTDSYAYIGFDPTGTGAVHGRCAVVVLSDGALDKAALNAAIDPWDELRKQQNPKVHTVVVLRLLDPQTVMIDMFDDQPLHHGENEPSAVFTLAQNSAQHVTGAYVSKHPAAEQKKGNFAWNLHFDVDIARTLSDAAAPKALTNPETSDAAPPPPPPPSPPPPGKKK